MKSILYVGATLMIGASVYGFVDYKQTRNKKEFKEMYAEEKTLTPVEKISDKTTVSPVKKDADNNLIVRNEKDEVLQKQVVSKEDPLIAIKPIAEEEKISPDKSTVIRNSSGNNGVEKKIKKKRKFSTRLFSRGALDERYIEPKEKVELPKEEVKKAENKEQL